ncbi:hypothetical protein RZS08_58595, partial [Arthrospira platensis SPKY1]|nr:hypothetical protein [Arthrospira platensis SPKY1]
MPGRSLNVGQMCRACASGLAASGGRARRTMLCGVLIIQSPCGAGRANPRVTASVSPALATKSP